MCNIPAPVGNQNKKRDEMPTSNGTSLEQLAIYLNPNTYRTDNGNFSLADYPANETVGLPPLALAELQAMGLKISRNSSTFSGNDSRFTEILSHSTNSNGSSYKNAGRRIILSLIEIPKRTPALILLCCSS